MEKYRVVWCGTGGVGRAGLRLLFQQPHLELVGQYVSTPEKAGQDSGVLAETDPVGVIATNSWEEVVALKADALIYCADSVKREREAIEDVIRFLEAGTNVVTISAWELGHRACVPPDLMARIDEACRKGNSSVFFTSIDPGWMTSDMVVASLAVANRVDCIRMIEFANFAFYEAEYACREYFGFGKEPGFQPILSRDRVIEEMWAPTLRRIADVLDVEIEEFKQVYETDSVDFDVETAFGLVKAGTASVVHFELQALKGGRPFIVLEHLDHVLPDLAACKKPWSRPKAEGASYRIDVTGDPSFSLEFYAHCLEICVTPAINCVPALVDAKPGLLSPVDIPRHWSRNITAKLGPWP